MSLHETLTLGLLPEKKLDWRKFVLSYGVVLFLILFLLLARLIWPDRMSTLASYTVTEIIPRPDLVSHKPKPKPKPQVAKLEPLPKFEAPKLVVPKEAPRSKVEVAKIEPPKIQPVLEAPKLQPVVRAMPRVIQTGYFGSSAPATVRAPVEKVQTGGFGDPKGLAGTGKQGAKLTATQLGSFDLPEGAGVGNGTGGTKGIKGTVASVGFGNGIAGPGHGDGHNAGQVAAAGFGSQQVAAAPRKHTLESDGPATSPIEILYKPKPVYTEEARNLRLEGEVLLEVEFAADGQLHVKRVVRGLGHGLDEAAVNAANKIKFKPAQRNGTAVDSTAIVHVVFALAS
jgi:TonB family protein